MERARFKVTGTNQSYDLAADPEAPRAMDEVAKTAGNIVTIKGKLMPPKDTKTPVPIFVLGLIDRGR
ncbi:MAG: hypothetical protein DMG59_16705 [Acidobacteria bacterium]|nr:MAG: hypothetical protein DMG59_16705 [Acidobacteriota bacterium]